MKKTLLFIALFLSINLFASIDVKVLEPAFWWEGMQNTELQVLVYGDKIAESNLKLTSKTCAIKRIEHLENPNYLLIYLDLSNARAEKFNFVFEKGGKKKRYPYEIKARKENARKQGGFDASDVLYLIMPDRFANGDYSNDLKNDLREKTINRKEQYARHGGDIKGIIDRLDYISDLGLTAIWLNPVLENDMEESSYHGYATTNYYKVDPRLGTNEEYVDLVEKAHQKGLKVVMDLIFNHCGSEHIFFKDRPSEDWFNFPNSYVKSSYRTNAQFDPYVATIDYELAVNGSFVEEMPDLNQRNPHVAKYLIQNSIYWIELLGIDGIRQDTHPYADFDMMAEWCKELEKEYPKFTIVGETWYHSNVQVAFWQKNSKLAAPRNSHLKVVMDFQLADIMETAFDEETSDWMGGFYKIQDYLSQDIVYEDPMNLLIFFENHDKSRFFKNDSLVDINKYKQALAFLLTTRGIPQLYYGSEILMAADKLNGDGLLREDFPGGWKEDSRNAFKAEGRTELENEAWSFTKRLLNFRKGNEVIAKGKLKHFLPRNSIYVYQRSYNGKSVLVFMNGSDTEKTLDLKDYKEVLTKDRAIDIISREEKILTKSLKMNAREVFIFDM